MRPLHQKSGLEVVRALLEIFGEFGAHFILQSDNGRKFLSLFSKKNALIKIRHIRNKKCYKKFIFKIKILLIKNRIKNLTNLRHNVLFLF